MNRGNCVFSVMLYTVSRKRHCFGLLYLRHSSTSFNILVNSKVVLLRTVCKYYFSPSHFVFETLYAACDWKDIISGLHVSRGSAETLVTRGGIVKHGLIACSLNNISAKIIKIGWSLSKLYCATSVSSRNSVVC